MPPQRSTVRQRWPPTRARRERATPAPTDLRPQRLRLQVIDAAQRLDDLKDVAELTGLLQPD